MCSVVAHVFTVGAHAVASAPCYDTVVAAGAWDRVCNVDTGQSCVYQ